jgi:hypothetical protein
LKKHPSLSKDLEILAASLLENPFQGTHLGKNCYKIRLAISSKSRGKSGGGRVITCVQIEDEHIFLLSIYDKSEHESLKDNELEELLHDAGLLGE